MKKIFFCGLLSLLSFAQAGNVTSSTQDGSQFVQPGSYAATMTTTIKF